MRAIKYIKVGIKRTFYLILGLIFEKKENYISNDIDNKVMSQSVDRHQTSDFCPSCHINLAERYCSECGMVFCLSCARLEVNEFYTCSRCGPGTVKETEEGNICSKCGEPARRATRQDYLCPNCGSSMVTPIHNMRQALVSRFRTTYYQLRKGHELIAGFAARLRMLRWRIRELRLGGFLHHPEIEKELLTIITKDLPSVHERIVFRAKGIVERHRASKLRFIQPEHWTTTDFPLLAGLIEGIQEDVTDYQNYCEELIKELDAKLATIEERLSPIAGWLKLFAAYVEQLCLTDNEHPVAVIYPVTLEKPTAGEGMHSGILFITTQRLLFVGQKGFFTREKRVIYAIPLKVIIGIEEEGRIRRRLLLNIDEEESLKIKGSSRILREIPEKIAYATTFSEHSLVTTSGSMRVLNLKVDVSSLRIELDQLINSAITSEEIDPRSHEGLSTLRGMRSGTYPAYPQHFGTGSSSPERDLLFTLQEQKYSIQATMQLLKRQFEEGKINDESFFKQYRSLTRDLYSVETRIRELSSYQNGESHY